MAALLEEVSEKRKKRKRKENKKCKRNLLVGETVEVRSIEEGFHGSWHSGTIIGCDDLVRHVRYAHLLLDDGSVQLTESICVSSMIEGLVPDDGTLKNYRGLIRPVPPLLAVQKWGLHYGFCVDAHVNDAWWEGVVFDHEDGSEERLIFFPDLGDQQTVRIEDLRITRDWDEVSECWKIRGNWLFLELIEEHEPEWPSVVSVRQIWYNVRAKEDFQKRISEWTCKVRSLWDVLVLEVIKDNMYLTAEHVLNVIDSHGVNSAEGPSKRRNTSKYKFSSSGALSRGQVEETQTMWPLATPDENVNSKPEADLTNSQSKRRKTIASNEVDSGGQVEECIPRLILQNEESRPVSYVPPGSDSCPLVPIGNVGSLDDLLMEDDDCCVGNLLDHSFDIKDMTLEDLAGFSCEVIDGSLASKVMPTDPNSFACIGFSTNDKRDHLTKTLSRDEARGRNKHWLPVGPDVLPGAEYCPDALVNYLLVAEDARSHHRRSKDINRSTTILKARMHISHLGWKIEFTKDKTKKDKSMLRVRYISPDEKTMYSLLEVCKYLTKTKRKVCTRSSQKGYQSNVRQVAPVSDVAVIEPGYCPQAVIDWYELVSGRKKLKLDNQSRDVRHLSLKARMHLVAVGWRFWYVEKQNEKRELRYTSPKGRSYYSLITACKCCMEEEGFFESTRPMEGMIAGEESKGLLSSAIMCTEVEESILPINGQSENGYMESSDLLQSREFLEFANVQVKGLRSHRKRRKNCSFPFVSRLLQSQTSSHLQTSQDGMAVAVSHERKLRDPLDHNAGTREQKKRKASRALIKQDKLGGSYRTRVLRSSKRARQVVVPSPVHRTPRTVLSWLIDNNVVLPRAKVHYVGRKDHRRMAEGRITREGIRCNCCRKVFGLTSFEAHAGSTHHRPSANIFLEDGRSLLQCQKQIVQDNKLKSFRSEPHERIKRNQPLNKNDYICSVCHYGGTLLLCDQCPSSFHLSCLGLKDLPEGKWFCPSCRCGICGQKEFNGNTEQFTEKTVLYCDQCEREYHVGCIRQRGLVRLKSCPKGNWFCSKKCEKVFVGLHKLLGKSISVGVDKLSWTILKSSKDEYHYFDASDIETMTEHHSKLNVALGVMHECFEPIKEPHTNRDLIEDVLFNKWSELSRLNFRGFYTVLLEREDELISVATVRVYGEKVAEVPLVGTRVQYRRRGMCRILMDVLEKKLTELGVERLLLPAVPQLLHAWTTSFGFSKMTNAERLKYLEYTFLGFQDTTMCQKILRTTTTVKLMESRRNGHKIGDELDRNDENIDPDWYNVVNEVVQAEQIEQSEIVEQILVEIPVDVAAVNGLSVETGSPIAVDTQVTDPERNPQNSEMDIGGECSNKSSNERKEYGSLGNYCMKYYRRRKIGIGGQCLRKSSGVKKENDGFSKDSYKCYERRRYRATRTRQASYQDQGGLCCNLIFVQ